MAGGRELPNGLRAAPSVNVGEQLIDVDPEPVGELSQIVSTTAAESTIVPSMSKGTAAVHSCPGVGHSLTGAKGMGRPRGTSAGSSNHEL